MLPGGMLKLRLSMSVRSPYALVAPLTSTTISPRRGPTGMVMVSMLDSLVYSDACMRFAALGNLMNYRSTCLRAQLPLLSHVGRAAVQPLRSFGTVVVLCMDGKFSSFRKVSEQT